MDCHLGTLNGPIPFVDGGSSSSMLMMSTSASSTPPSSFNCHSLRRLPPSYRAQLQRGKNISIISISNFTLTKTVLASQFMFIKIIETNDAAF